MSGPDPGEAARSSTGRTWWVTAAASALAASALLSLDPTVRVGKLSDMAPKGAEMTSAPELALKVAVARRGGPAERLRGDTIYEPGDAFFFRYRVGGPGELSLLRAAYGRVRVLDSRHVEGGEADLTDGSPDARPLAWTAEPADGRAIFALVTTQGPATALAEALERTLDDGADARAFCAAAEGLGARCDARDVEVAP